MYATSHRMQQPGPLAPWMHGGNMSREMQDYAQRGQQAFMQSAGQIEHFMEENATTMCVAGFLLGTFVDRRFLLLPLAIGGLKLWRSMQHS